MTMPVCSRCGLAFAEAYGQPMTMLRGCKENRQHRWDMQVEVVPFALADDARRVMDAAAAKLLLDDPRNQEPEAVGRMLADTANRLRSQLEKDTSDG